jgi:hypothetical protein
MHVLLTTYGSRGEVEPLVGLTVRLQAPGVGVRMCAPPDEVFVEMPAGVGVPIVPFAKPWRSWLRPFFVAHSVPAKLLLGAVNRENSPAPATLSTESIQVQGRGGI